MLILDRSSLCLKSIPELLSADGPEHRDQPNNLETMTERRTEIPLAHRRHKTGGGEVGDAEHEKRGVQAPHWPHPVQRQAVANKPYEVLDRCPQKNQRTTR